MFDYFADTNHVSLPEYSLWTSLAQTQTLLTCNQVLCQLRGQAGQPPVALDYRGFL